MYRSSIDVFILERERSRSVFCLEGLKIFDFVMGFPEASLPQEIRIRYVPLGFGVMFAIEFFLSKFHILTWPLLFFEIHFLNSCTKSCTKPIFRVFSFIFEWF